MLFCVCFDTCLFLPTNIHIGLLVTALPCRLQNDSPPNSIEQSHLNKENDSPVVASLNGDALQRINENNNLIKAPKLPPDIESAIDESNYVNLNEITAKCKAISNDFARSAQKPAEHLINGIEKPTGQTHIDNKASKLNNFYLQINSTASNGHNASKPIMSIVNQKNINNLNNNIPKTGLANHINGNANHTNGFAGNAIHLNNTINGNINNNGNGVLNDSSVDSCKSITTNGMDFNKNGLPAPSTAHLHNDVANGHQTQCIKNGNPTPQTYVIHNGNGLLTNGNSGNKEMPRADKGELQSMLVLLLILCLFRVIDIGWPWLASS